MKRSSEPRPRFRRAPEEKRRAILAVARRGFAERGYEHTTTAEIARRAGVSEGTIFNHFQSKQGLLEAVVEQHARDLAQVLIEATDWNRPTVERPIRRALEFARKNGRIARPTAGPHQGRLRAIIRRKLRSEMVKAGAEVFERWQQRGIVRPMNAEIVAELLFPLVDTLLRQAEKDDGTALAEQYVREAVLCFEGAIALRPELQARTQPEPASRRARSNSASITPAPAGGTEHSSRFSST